MRHGGDADSGEDDLLGDALLQQNLFMGADALSAAVDGRDDQRPELEVEGIGAVGAHDVHAQAGGHGAVLFIGAEVMEAVVDVVHAHDGRGALGGGDDFGRDVGGGFGLHGGQQLRAARSIGGGDERTPLLIAGQLGGIDQRRPVEAEVFGVVGQAFQHCFEGHSSRAFPVSRWKNMGAVRGPRPVVRRHHRGSKTVFDRQSA